MYKELLKDIEASDMILVGVGESVTLPYDFNSGRHELEFWKKYNDDCKKELEEKVISFYNSLEKILMGKNYFFITTNMDGFIHKSLLNPIRIVSPCGNIHKLQCKCEGVEGIIDASDDFYEKGESIYCPKCKSAYEPNIYNKEYYNEEGYLKQWNLYNKWLQGTLNKKLLVLEIGCGFSMMSLIRLPFEKVVMINQKSLMYRVHDKFPQVTAELKDRMKSLEVNPFVFVRELEMEKNSLL